MTMYHGSPVAGITELGTLSTTHDEARDASVYLTPNRAYALFYIRDPEINFVTCSVAAEGYVKYFENFPDQLRTLYKGKCGFLYKCGIRDSFEETSEKDVWVSKKPVSVTAVEEIRDVYAEILKCEANGLVRVFRYESLSEERKCEIQEIMLYSIYKNNYTASASKKARFFKEKFPQAWDYAFSHPGERQKITTEWEQKQAKRQSLHDTQ